MRALVLKKIRFSKTDAVVHFFLENGKVLPGFAAGAMRSKRRFPHQFHIAGVYELEWTRSSPDKSLHRLHKCELLEFYPKLSEDLLTLSRWSSVLEWILLDEAAHFEFEEVFSLMRTLENSRDPLICHLFFLEQMKRHGLLPQLEGNCLVCGEDLRTWPRWMFSMSDGGVVHSRCLPAQAAGIRLTEPTLEFLKSVLEADRLSDLLAGRQEDEFYLQVSIYRELDELILPYLEFQLGLPLKTQRFLREISPEVQTNVEHR